MMNLSYAWAKALKRLRGKALANSTIHATSRVEPGSSVVNTTFDRYTYCGYDCAIMDCDVGAFCSIADNVSIGDSRHPMEWVSMSPVFYAALDTLPAKISKHIFYGKYSEVRTRIGNDVWIGKGALIKPGISIGDGAIIGMGSVVTKDVESYTIVGGNPAKVIRKRFDDATVEKLMQIKWWTFDDEKLSKYAEFFTSPSDFINAIEKK